MQTASPRVVRERELSDGGELCAMHLELGSGRWAFVWEGLVVGDQSECPNTRRVVPRLDMAHHGSMSAFSVWLIFHHFSDFTLLTKL